MARALGLAIGAVMVLGTAPVSTAQATGGGFPTRFERYLSEVRPQLLVDANDITLFLTDRGQPFLHNRLSDLVKGYLERSGIEKPGVCHLFRHTMATLMLDNGADLRFIQVMLGHSRIETTTIYTQVAIKKLKEVYERTHPAKMERQAKDDDGAA